jgi:hypothetical protein
MDREACDCADPERLPSQRVRAPAHLSPDNQGVPSLVQQLCCKLSTVIIRWKGSKSRSFESIVVGRGRGGRSWVVVGVEWEGFGVRRLMLLLVFPYGSMNSVDYGSRYGSPRGWVWNWVEGGEKRDNYPTPA